jgi:hypothetical protein
MSRAFCGPPWAFESWRMLALSLSRVWRYICSALTQQEHTMSSPRLSFDLWKQRLQADCVQKEKLNAFNAIGDFTLEMFWKLELEPTVQAIVDNADQPSQAEKFFPSSDTRKKSA